jgi:two-component system response regulator
MPEPKMPEDRPDQPEVSADATDATILVVEGQPDDRLLIARLIAQLPLSLSVVTVGSATEAMDFIENSHGEGRRPPELVIVDFDLPDMSAARLLARLRRHGTHRTVPVVALTRSGAPDLVRRAYDFGANAVINRSGPPETLREIVRTVVDFWFRVANRYLVD